MILRRQTKYYFQFRDKEFLFRHMEKMIFRHVTKNDFDRHQGIIFGICRKLIFWQFPKIFFVT